MQFKFTMVPGQTITYDLSASNPMKDGLFVTVEARAA